ncbi:MAG: c-type cytochrome [Chitinophagales bacterium]
MKLYFFNNYCYASICAVFFFLTLESCRPNNSSTASNSFYAAKTNEYVIPDTSLIPNDKTGNEIRYGLELITKTAKYLGPNGSVMQLTGNKMNCKNCHLDEGRRLFSNNFIETYLKYPQYRAREGKVLTIEDRVNNCFERPMNGKILPYDSREMRAIVAYIRWLSDGHIASFKKDSFHLGEISLIDRAASPENGKKVYENNCARCHGENGQGKMDSTLVSYQYPPLWGRYSYAAGSSMHRVITASRFIKWSMPYNAVPSNPVLSDEDAFDVAAYINDDKIHPRPYRKLEVDCPDLENKPIDFPSGPFLDTFPIIQHKYGPFKPIVEYYKQRKK